jgi:hypothetical protein
MNIVHFREYCKENFNMDTWGDRIKDKRKRPIIPVRHIFESLCEMPLLGQRSLLELDEFLRTPEARRWHTTSRRQVASDTTLERVAGGIAHKSLEDIGYDMIDHGDEQALWDLKLPGRKKLRLGIIDGHHAGGIWMSVLASYGKTDGIVDIERYRSRGLELPASRKLLKRAFRRLGRGFFGVIVGDGLYASREDFKLCLANGSHLVVKTDEKDLTVIQDAQYLFRVHKKVWLKDVFSKNGHDSKRNSDYEVMWTEGIEWQGLLLTVGWIQEWRLNSEGITEHTEFWVLTTATGLQGEDLRELAHLRWEIENNVFKRLNQLAGSKRKYSHKPKVMEILFRIWIIGLTLLGAYLFECGWMKFKQTWQAMKQTWRAVTTLMRRSLVIFCA